VAKVENDESMNATLAVHLEREFEKNRLQDYLMRYMQYGQNIEGIRCINLPYGNVSGDFHLTAEHNGSRYIFVAGACGHGLSAILPVLHIPKIFTTMAQKGLSILTIADEINALLCKQNIIGHFLASTLIHMDLISGHIEVLNCGNPSAYLVNEDRLILHEFKSKSLALGTVGNDCLDLHLDYVKCDDKCNEKAHIYVFTGGLVDTQNEFGVTGQTFSFEEIVKECSSASDIFNTIESKLTTALAQGQADDITFMEIPYVKKLHVIKNNIATLDSIINIPEPRASNDDAELLKEMTLLSIDDEPSQKELVHCLGRVVGGIYRATNKSEGLRLFQEKQPSLVIIGSHFLDKDGLSMISNFKCDDSAVPIIIASDRGMTLSTEQLFELGIKRYLMKPFLADKVIGTVKSCLHYQKNKHNLNLSSFIFNSSSLAMTITSKDKMIVAVNSSFCRITGFSEEDVIGRNPKLLSSGKHDAKFYCAMWDCINTTHEWSGEIWNKRRNGELFLEWVTINAITNTRGEVTNYISVFSDITERNATEEAIHKLTYHDPLTLLPNRRLFLDRLGQEVRKVGRSQQKVAVLFVDLDNFKDINDTLGHDVGDNVLKQVATKLTGCVRGSDSVARFGGDEFTICLINLKSVEDAGSVAQTILNEVKKPFTVNDEKFYLSVSIGISIYPDDSVHCSDLIKHADQAMFVTKRNGRSGFHYFKPVMQEKAILRKEIIDDLRLAIAGDQFIVYYQPIIELATEKIYKAEALVRWQHPIRGLVSPVDFIPIAEDTGMIGDIGNWVFKQAAVQAKKWQTAFNIDFQVSINKSPKQFKCNRDDHLTWFDYLNGIGLLPRHVIIEITEGLLMESNLFNTDQLLTFRDQGIQIALDDFGTGYSSLAYLKKLDIDYLKIDRSFVSNLTKNSDDLVLCEAIIVMAHKLGIQVIAEGIETPQQKQLLLDAGCDFGQGYLFSRPVPANEFEALLTKSV